MKTHTFLRPVLILLSCLYGCAPNLIVSNLEENWDQTNKKARAEIANIGNRDADFFWSTSMQMKILFRQTIYHRYVITCLGWPKGRLSL